MLKENFLVPIYNNIADMVFIVEVEEYNGYRFLSGNKSYLAAAGYSEEQVVGKRIEEIYPKAASCFLIQKFEQANKLKKIICYEEIPDYFNSKLILETKIIPIFGNKGHCTHLLWIARDNTERQQLSDIKQTFETLRISEEKFRMLFNKANDAIGLFEITDEGLPGRIIECNDVVCKRLGYSREELLAMMPYQIINPKDIKPEIIIKLKENGSVTFETTEMAKNGVKRPVEANLHIFDLNGKKVVLTIARDITERKIKEKALQETNQLLQQIIESFPDATLVIDHNKNVIAWNRAMKEMTGVKKGTIIGKGDFVYAEPFYGKKRPLLIDLIFSENQDSEQLYAFVQKKGKALYTESFTPALYKGKGAFVWATASPLFNSENSIIGAIESIRDITERKRMEERMQYLATHDALTNIPNRYYLDETLKRVTVRAKHGNKSALLIIDLDNFKLINDTLGHAAGDELLINIVDIIKRNLHESDFLARLGGDEFAVLLEGISAQDAAAIAERLRRAIGEKELYLVTHKCCFNLSISIGIIMIDGSFDYHRYLSLADIALYAAKEGGRNRIVFAQPDENSSDRLTETNRLIGLIKSALQDDLFELEFQPVVRLSDGKIIHHEALIRLRDKNGQVILPGKFIPVAEHFGLMSQIDRWVVRAALSAMREFRKLKLFINISGVTLGDEAILDEIESDICSSGVEPSRIGFEITETAAVKDLLQAERWVCRLKSLGCLFALDDFGTGFSSFSYLRILPVDYIKIDESFIRNVDKEPVHSALIQAIHTIANTLGMKTIAEFVENEDVLMVLKTLGIDFGQGYFLGRPGSYSE